MLANAEIALAAAQAAARPRPLLPRDLRREVERREALHAELLAGLDAGRDRAVLPAADRPRDRGASPASRRWSAGSTRSHGLLTPAAFLDFAEQTDLTERIGELVLTRSLEALTAWDAAGLAVPRVGVNFALAQLRDPRLIEKIKWETERFDIEPRASPSRCWRRC